MEIGRTPWLLALLTAAWFVWLAKRAGRSVTLWGVGGAAFGLVTSTIILGLGQAVSIPFSDQERTADQIKWTVAAVFIIAVAGWVLTSGLHRLHLVVWRKIKPGQDSLSPIADPKPSTVPPAKTSTTRP